MLVIAYDPNAASVMKSSSMNDAFPGADARLVRYLRNGPPRHMITSAVRELARRGLVPLLTERTRTMRMRINPVEVSVAIVAKHADVSCRR